MMQPTKTHLAMEKLTLTAQFSPQLDAMVLVHYRSVGVRGPPETDMIGGDHRNGGEDVKAVYRKRFH